MEFNLKAYFIDKINTYIFLMHEVVILFYLSAGIYSHVDCRGYDAW